MNKPNGARPTQQTMRQQSLLNIHNAAWSWAAANGSGSMTLKDVRDVLNAMASFMVNELNAHYAAGAADKQAEMERAATEKQAELPAAEPPATQ